MIRAIHIEDEPRNTELLQSLIITHCSDSVILVGNAANLPDAFKLIKNEKPQLVYLDIELNQGNAFELLQRVQDDIGIDFEIIFITAFNEYAVKAFRQNAVDYLLKPISTTELKEATARAADRINNKGTIKNIFEALNQLKQNKTPSKIGFPVNDGLQFLDPNNIIRIEAKGSYTIVYLLDNKKITCTKNLKEIEALLDDAQFLRVHNAWVINSKYLKKYFRGKNSYIQMDDGSNIPVSIRKKGDFLDNI